MESNIILKIMADLKRDIDITISPNDLATIAHWILSDRLNMAGKVAKVLGNYCK